MGTAITTGITTAISAVGSVMTAVFDAEGSWAPVLAVIGLAVGFFVCRTGVRIIKSLIQGY